MPRPKTPLRERIENRSEWIGDHLIWQGQMRKGRPQLDRIGNPARVLLNLTEHPDYQIRKSHQDCAEPRCIAPHHWRVIKEKRMYYDDAPRTPWADPRILSDLTAQQQEEVRECIEWIKAGDMTCEDLDADYPPEIRDEVLKHI